MVINGNQKIAVRIKMNTGGRLVLIDINSFKVDQQDLVAENVTYIFQNFVAFNLDGKDYYTRYYSDYSAHDELIKIPFTPFSMAFIALGGCD
jgi:hypothetical protein